MAKVIQIKKNYIPFRFEDEEGNLVYELRYDRTDESKDRLLDAVEELDEIAKKVDEAEKDGSPKAIFQSTKQFIQSFVDSVLGDGVFDELYKMNPSSEIVFQYTLIIFKEILEEMNEFEHKDQVQKYLNG